ncbi:c-type cytochrome [Ferruginibacter sp.]
MQTKELNGTTLYTANCQSCHQSNGEGLPGAFPPLKRQPRLLMGIIWNYMWVSS